MATRPSSSGSSTITIVEDRPSSSSSSAAPPPEVLVLRLNRPKKKVSWKEGTVDNEFLQRKSSKKCCIFHKQKPFDEDCSDEEGENDGDGCGGKSVKGVDRTGAPDGCCSHGDETCPAGSA